MELEIVERNWQAEKNDWIFLHGSNLLQRSIIEGYPAQRRYVLERAAIEYPEFELLEVGEYVRKVDSPPLTCLKACAAVEGAYCAEMGWSYPKYYIAIDYMGQTIVKKIKNPYRQLRADELYRPREKKKLLGIAFLSSPFIIILISFLLLQVRFFPLVPPLTESQRDEVTKELLTPISMGK